MRKLIVKVSSSLSENFRCTLGTRRQLLSDLACPLNQGCPLTSVPNALASLNQISHTLNSSRFRLALGHAGPLMASTVGVNSASPA